MIPGKFSTVPRNPNTIAMAIFGLDKTLLNNSRAIYNALDFLGDVGGLSDALKIISWFLVSFFGTGGFSTQLRSKIFYE